MVIAGGFVVAAVLELVLLPRFVRSPIVVHPRLAGSVGVLGICGGAVWIAVSALTADGNIRRFRMMALGPLGVPQLLCGAGLLSWTIGAPGWLMSVSVTVAFCLMIGTAIVRASGRP